MTEEKKKRVLSAVLSGMIMLITTLVVIITYQLIGIFSRKNEIARLDAEIVALQAQIEATESEIESWELDWKIIQRARELGMYFENEDE